MSKKIWIWLALNFGWLLILILTPIIVVVIIVVVIMSMFSSRQQTQHSYLRAIFDPEIPISNFLDGTDTGRDIHDFIVFSRIQLANVQQASNAIVSDYNIRNIEFREDLDRDEQRESELILLSRAVLRQQVVFYSIYLRPLSPIPRLFGSDEEIWEDIEAELSREASENDYPDRNWENAVFPNYHLFSYSFFDISPVIYFENAPPIYEGIFLWERQDNADSFFNSRIYSNIFSNTGNHVTAVHQETIELVWDYIIGRIIDFTGRFAPPVYPERFGNITSPFGHRTDPFTGRSSFHNGIDWAWGPGTYGSGIFAVYDGIVTRSGYYANGFGVQIWITHPNGWQTVYAHNSRNSAVVGERVRAGQLIGFIGNTGRSTAPHLHLGLMVGGIWVDPMQLWQ